MGANETYGETPNADLGLLGLLLQASGFGGSAGNAREYAIYPDGSLHPAATGAPDPPGMPDPGAFLPGWPTKIADLDPGLLPTIGDGVGASPALADLTGSGKLQIVTSATVGPLYVLNPDGSSFLGNGSDGLPTVAAFQPPDVPLSDILSATLPSLGAPIVRRWERRARRPASSIPPAVSGDCSTRRSTGSRRRTTTRSRRGRRRPARSTPAIPRSMNDLQFFDEPIVANVTGASGGGSLVEGSGINDLRAYGPTGVEATGYPKFTGGWMVGSAALGPFGADQDQVLVAGTRLGALYIWSTPTPACASSGPWPQEHHDLWNTGNLSETGAPAPACRVTTDPRAA